MGRQSGYTLVEVMLFFAITGLLILIVINGFSSSINNNRRIDTVRSFEGAIEKVYSSVRSGEAARPVDTSGKTLCKTKQAFPGASDECVILGKLLAFLSDQRRVSVYNVVASITPDAACITSATGVEAIGCYEPVVLDMTTPQDTILPEWQARIQTVTFPNTSGGWDNDYTMIALLRQPSSEVVYIAPFKEGSLSSIVAAPGQYALRTKLDNDTSNGKGHICLRHDEVSLGVSYVRFNGGEGVGSIDTGNSPLTGVPAC